MPRRYQTPAPAVPPSPSSRPERGRTWRIDIPAGQELLNANQRLHWAAKARITKQLRSDAFLLAKYRKIPRLKRAHILCVYEPPTRGRGVTDVHNLTLSAKALVDGLVDAGVLEDDRDEFLVGPDMRRGKPHPNSRLVLLIIELPKETSQ